MRTALKVGKTQNDSAENGKEIKHLTSRYTDKKSLFKGLSINAFQFLQALSIVAAYAVLAYFFPYFLYFSCVATLLVCFYIIFRFDGQIRVSWLVLMLASCGFGYIAFLMSQKEIICFGTRRRYKNILLAENALDGTYIGGNVEFSTDKSVDYLRNIGGFEAYTGNLLSYFSDAHTMFEDIFLEIERAEKFIFIETFIICDGVLLDRLLELIFRKIEQGVEVYLIYDSAGCQRMLTGKTERLLKSSKIHTLEFKPMFGLFHIAQNFRDHRKIFVIDGRVAYIGGSNIDDECANLCGLDFRWRDNALKIDGVAVESVSKMFVRQWSLAGGKIDKTAFVGAYVGGNEQLFTPKSDAVTVPYVSGVEVKTSICFGLYLTMIENARKFLYICSPYFVPDKKIFNAIKTAAKSGVDVRLILPEVCDYAFIYRVTQSYAESLIEFGVKVYYVKDSFMHSKTILTESGVSIGSANLDIRSFFEEYDNGVYTDDVGIRAEVLDDCNRIFETCPISSKQQKNIFMRAYVALLKLFAPLM